MLTFENIFLPYRSSLSYQSSLGNTIGTCSVLISIHGRFIMYLNIPPDDLYQKIMQKLKTVNYFLACIIIESVDSISRDGPDTLIYVIHNKNPKSSV